MLASEIARKGGTWCGLDMPLGNISGRSNTIF